jgi:hypothetical protein
MNVALIVALTKPYGGFRQLKYGRFTSRKNLDSTTKTSLLGIIQDCFHRDSTRIIGSHESTKGPWHCRFPTHGPEEKKIAGESQVSNGLYIQ